MISERAEYDPKQLETMPTTIIVTQIDTCKNKRGGEGRGGGGGLSHIGGKNKIIIENKQKKL